MRGNLEWRVGLRRGTVTLPPEFLKFGAEKRTLWQAKYSTIRKWKCFINHFKDRWIHWVTLSSWSTAQSFANLNLCGCNCQKMCLLKKEQTQYDDVYVYLLLTTCAERAERRTDGRPCTHKQSPEKVDLQLISAKCMLILLYGLEAFSLYNYQLKSLDFFINRFFMKLFRTSNMHAVSDCQEQLILFYPVFNSPAVLRNLWTSWMLIKFI